MFDLDAARAGEADGKRRPLSVKFNKKTYEIPRPLPLLVAIALTEGDFKTAVNQMFGSKAQEVLKAGLDIQDIRAIADELLGGSGE